MKVKNLMREENGRTSLRWPNIYLLFRGLCQPKFYLTIGQDNYLPFNIVKSEREIPNRIITESFGDIVPNYRNKKLSFGRIVLTINFNVNRNFNNHKQELKYFRFRP